MKHFEHLLQEGMEYMTESIQLLLYNSNPQLFEQLDLENANTFAEPLLYSWYNLEQPSFTLEQVLAGYLKEQHYFSISAYTDRAGCICLPAIGYLHTSMSDTYVNVVRNGGQFHVIKNGREMAFRFTPCGYIQDTDIEIYKYRNDLYNQHFNNDPRYNLDHNTWELLQDSVQENIQQAYNMIAAHNPVYFPYMQAVAKGIFLFRDDPAHAYSFASVKAQGAVFLNLQEGNGVPFFMEEMVHQFGHCILAAVLADKGSFFRIPEETPMSALTGNTADGRSFYDAFHGLFTTYAVAQLLDIVISKQLLQGAELHEAKGRFIYNQRRIHTGIQSVNHAAVLTPKGTGIYNYLQKELEKIYLGKESMIAGYQFSNQSFVFNYNHFARLNPVTSQVL
ncbi:hypothetical protein ECE50_015975 [Chitinophaga sp. Mgbs1]|uniref:HEXXH motif domain-containing protein n=1 Tax=Chitinophaga solisilvae TaxID=1233460 RepID=A0A9Q5DBK2_9BACT|nr:hypothetical protein [Chitinophaga solisilvae]